MSAVRSYQSDSNFSPAMELFLDFRGCCSFPLLQGMYWHLTTNQTPTPAKLFLGCARSCPTKWRLRPPPLSSSRFWKVNRFSMRCISQRWVELRPIFRCCVLSRPESLDEAYSVGTHPYHGHPKLRASLHASIRSRYWTGTGRLGQDRLSKGWFVRPTESSPPSNFGQNS
ncbi:hypothetical protein BDV26DRAFT_257667 [Aspergillus bertholletiae]|uniref:Uncharacterized protein n=1 Tax=Aspergillus bertholletiae TaxID=1226010 RepID=A0A5N7BER4_9EURO|nr:hypothetical protein BDV26DRAFT_257667 [Aspergillus bertholletiae]